ncbi:hypothetical protein [Erythrobacter sp. F6033]|uniref:hypothetical protein n=1 Tax=Erythrobacter sp. F6033 TaxID=2926401 RepID=UPI001FF365EF|nr:hypothetical protein [Erythrobacter sp. F6033]MCK0129581.1 hypothetical protein [Erythrobacter sp. F6033]
MALLVLIVLGATLGWLASILTRSEASGAILRQMGLSMLATIAVGLFVNEWTFIGGLSVIALGAGFAGGVIALIIYHFFVKDPAEV